MNNYLIPALTLRGEADDQGLEGQVAVMNVIMNRSVDRRYEDKPVHRFGVVWHGVSAVCLQRMQFSCWNGDAGERLYKRSARDAHSLIAKLGMAGLLRDLTSGATHYYAWSGAHAIADPSWVRNSRNPVHTTDVGAHRFYKGID